MADICVSAQQWPRHALHPVHVAFVFAAIALHAVQHLHGLLAHAPSHSLFAGRGKQHMHSAA
jgi:hypothetical protein